MQIHNCTINIIKSGEDYKCKVCKKEMSENKMWFQNYYNNLNKVCLNQ